VKKLFNTYRILAFTVGVLLLLGTASVLLTGELFNQTLYSVSHDSVAHKIGHPLGLVWILHGWIYIGYVVVAFLLSRHAGWTLRFLGVLLIAGLVPGLIFWIERLVDERVRPWIAEEAEEAAEAAV
jgi:integral membrane protein